MKKHIAYMIVLSLLTLPLVTTTAVYAYPVRQLAVCQSNQGIFGFSPWYACLPGGNEGEPRIESLNHIFLIIFPILEGLVKAAAFVAAAFIFISIIKFITARGNAGKAATAMGGVRDAVVGFIIALISVAIVNTIASAFVAS